MALFIGLECPYGHDRMQVSSVEGMRQGETVTIRLFASLAQL